MNYAILAIILWAILTVLFILLSKSEVFRRYGDENGRLSPLVGRNFLAIAMAISAFFSIIIALLLKNMI
jgi:hypothetical protein